MNEIKEPEFAVPSSLLQGMIQLLTDDKMVGPLGAATRMIAAIQHIQQKGPLQKLEEVKKSDAN